MSLSAPSIPRVCEALCTELCARLGPLLRTVLYTALYPGLCVMLALGCYRSHERGGDGGEGAPRDAAARDGAAARSRQLRQGRDGRAPDPRRPAIARRRELRPGGRIASQAPRRPAG